MKYISTCAVAIVIGMTGAVAGEPAETITLPESWDAFDVNDDYYALKHEVNRVAPNLNFEAADVNGDRVLSRTEFIALEEQIANGTWSNTP